MNEEDMKELKKETKKQNQGFSLITVMVSVSFIGIMALIVLYMSLSNFTMKITDLKAKDSFYTAENALDEIRVGLQKEVGEAMSDAYVEVLEAYTDESAGSVEGFEQKRQNEFQERYLEKLKERLKDAANDAYYSMSKIKDYVDLFGKITEEESLKIVNPENTSPVMTQGGTESGLLLKNLKVIYVDPKGRASVIETDIRLGMPKVQFPTPSTLPDLMNMIVAAGQGIVCGNDSEAENTKEIHIQGSIYAGQELGENWKVNDTKSLYIKDGQKVYLDKGEKLVCLGEIQVGNNSLFSNKGGVDLWAQGLSVTSGTVELAGKTYFADDMTLNTTTNRSVGSTVTVEGEYYGYGSHESADGSYFGDNKYRNWSNTAKDSAIIVNGKGSTLDLAAVSKFMLAGNSYIGSSKVRGDRANTGDVRTGESLTVKGNQLAYLVSPKCFRDEKHTNPMDYDTYIEVFDEGELFDFDKKIDAWGGKSLHELGLNQAEPIQKIFYSDVGGKGFVYFYLNFESDGKASEFFEKFYNDPQIKANMDKYLNFYLGENKGITMKDKSAFLRFVTKGNILTYNGGNGTDGQGKLQAATDAAPAENQIQEQINLQNMWYALTRKMISSYDLLKENVKRDSTDPGHNEKAANRYVYDNLVDEEGLREFLSKQGNRTEYRFQVSSGGDILSAYVVDNEGGSAFPIDGTTAETARLVVATGDVEIEEGVTYRGIIMAKGRLYMRTGSNLFSAPLEAAKVFQAQREVEGEAAPMDFFWDGDKYILGNSGTDNIPGGEVQSKDTYDLSECITYENWIKK